MNTPNEIQADPLIAIDTGESERVPIFRLAFRSRFLTLFGTGSVGFVAAKVTVFLLPLFLSRNWSLHEYGLFEYALAWGALLAVPLGVGMSGAIPYFLLRRANQNYLSTFQVHSLLMAGLLLLMSIGHLTRVLNDTPYVTGFISVLLVIQSIQSTVYKVEEAPARASLLESGIYVFLSMFVLTLWLARIKFSFTLFIFGLNIYGIILSFDSLRGLCWDNIRDLARYRSVLKFGFPLIVTSAAIIFLVSSTRLLAGKVFSIESVGIYSFFFRLTSPVILVHSLLTTVYFRRLYEAEDRTLDRFFLLVIAVISSLSLALFVITPKLAGSLFPLLAELKQYIGIYLVLSFQMVFWTSIALAEIIIYRQEQASKFAVVLLATIGVFLLSTLLFKLKGTLTLLVMSRLQMSSMYLTLVGQMYLLRGSGVRLYKTSFFATSVFVLYWLTASFVN